VVISLEQSRWTLKDGRDCRRVQFVIEKLVGLVVEKGPKDHRERKRTCGKGKRVVGKGKKSFGKRKVVERAGRWVYIEKLRYLSKVEDTEWTVERNVR